jgi:hypothetical protein
MFRCFFSFNFWSSTTLLVRYIFRKTYLKSTKEQNAAIPKSGSFQVGKDDVSQK